MAICKFKPQWLRDTGTYWHSLTSNTVDKDDKFKWRSFQARAVCLIISTREILHFKEDHKLQRLGASIIDLHMWSTSVVYRPGITKGIRKNIVSVAIPVSKYICNAVVFILTIVGYSMLLKTYLLVIFPLERYNTSRRITSFKDSELPLLIYTCDLHQWSIDPALQKASEKNIVSVAIPVSKYICNAVVFSLTIVDCNMLLKTYLLVIVPV